MSIQQAGVEFFAVCDDGSCTSSAERVIPFDAPESTAWDTIAANLSVVYGQAISAERAEQMASMIMTWVSQGLLSVKDQLDQQNP